MSRVYVMSLNPRCMGCVICWFGLNQKLIYAYEVLFGLPNYKMNQIYNNINLINQIPNNQKFIRFIRLN
jgi:hypothetical protein